MLALLIWVFGHLINRNWKWKWSRSVVSDSLWPRGPGSSAHGILQARTLEWVAVSSSRGSSRPRDQTWVSRIAGRCFTPPGKPPIEIDKRPNVKFGQEFLGLVLQHKQVRTSYQHPCFFPEAGQGQAGPLYGVRRGQICGLGWRGDLGDLSAPLVVVCAGIMCSTLLLLSESGKLQLGLGLTVSYCLYFPPTAHACSNF